MIRTRTAAQSPAFSTSWGRRGRTTVARSTSWGGRGTKAVSFFIAALTAAIPAASATSGLTTAAPDLRTRIVVGTDAVRAVREVGGQDERSAGLSSAAVARLSDAQVSRLRAGGLTVADDAPVTLNDATPPASDPAAPAADPAAPEAAPEAPADSAAPEAPADSAAPAAPADSATTESAVAGPVAAPPAVTPRVGQLTTVRTSSAITPTTVPPVDAGEADSAVGDGTQSTATATNPPAVRHRGAADLVENTSSALGAGITVAVVDSGVAEVPALAGRVIQGADFTGEGMADRFGHGTFVAGLIAGNGAGLDGRDTGIRGLAPLARVLSVKVADADGKSSLSRLFLGLAWVINHRDTYRVDVVNLSLSTGRAASYNSSPINALVEAAWFSGMTVVASAGNTGGRVTSAPANDPYVLTVGSVDDKGTPGVGDDTVSPFSNRGRTLDGFVKPELNAPGQHVQSTLPVGSVLAGRQTTRGLPAGYGQLSGTSMSAAIASGAVAVLESARGGLSPDRVKGTLVGSRRHHAKQLGLANALRASSRTRLANRGLRPSVALAIAYAVLVLHTTDFAAVHWTDVHWTDVHWTDVTWTNATWTDATWTDATWTSATWTDATWTDATWTDATWTDATWTDATWTDAVWTQAVWTDAADVA